MSKTKETKIKKILGGSKYANSKKKLKDPKIAKDKMAVDKNRSLKVKIKHLQKEQKRIENSAEGKSGDSKISTQKSDLQEKINKLMGLLKKYTADLKK
jgi:hypothetical protein